jgi:uncharacterized protein
MSHKPQLSRRQALKFLASAPLLPLGPSLASTLLSGCGGGETVTTTAPVLKAAPTFASVSFTSMAAPTLANAASMATTSVGSTMVLSRSSSRMLMVMTLDLAMAFLESLWEQLPA